MDHPFSQACPYPPGDSLSLDDGTEGLFKLLPPVTYPIRFPSRRDFFCRTSIREKLPVK